MTSRIPVPELTWRIERLFKCLGRPYSIANHHEYRGEYLSIIASANSHEDTIVCLWLLDRDAEFCELRLEQAFIRRDNDVRRSGEEGAPGIFVRFRGEANEQTVLQAAKKWLAVGGPDTPLKIIPGLLPDTGHAISDNFRPLFNHEDDGSHGERVIALLQMIDRATERAPQRDNDWLEGAELRVAAQALASDIERSRIQRIWRVHNEMGKHLLAAATIDDATRVAADLVRRGSHAQHCRITYCRSDRCETKWDGGSSSPGFSPPDTEPCRRRMRVAPRPLRLFDVTDPEAIQERPDEGPGPDRPFLSWLGVPVEVDSWNNKDTSGKGSICVIEVVGKNPPGHFYSSFSETDRGFIDGVASMLANVLPRLEAAEALKTIGDRLANITSATEVLEIYETVDTLVHEVAPCSTFLAVIEDDNIRYIGSKEYSSSLDASLQVIKLITEDTIIEFVRDYGHAYVIPLSGLEGFASHMVIGISTSYILSFRREFLLLLAREVTGFIGDRLRYKKLIRDQTEVRHILRAGLTGMLGHMRVALKLFNRFGTRDPGIAYERLLRDETFAHSLKWAYLFSERTKVFLDQNRFLIANIKREEMKITFFDIELVILDIVQCLYPDAEDRECQIIVKNNMPQQFSKGWADRDMIYILLFNIIDNAVKYSYRNKQIHISVSATQDDWLVKVEDTGVHIPENQILHLFDQFRRLSVDAPQDSRRPGTGLGLAVAQKILEAHNARYEIDVTSIPVANTTAAVTVFTIPIPRVFREAK
ncbi:MAG: sensor histidine kinase [Alphaproteobacteria bacterium]